MNASLAEWSKAVVLSFMYTKLNTLLSKDARVRTSQLATPSFLSFCVFGISFFCFAETPADRMGGEGTTVYTMDS